MQTSDNEGPSLEQQLKDSRVIAGSALETLIKQNQDFSILDPSELHDDLPFPLWLRVFVRKTHPEIDFSGGKVRISAYHERDSLLHDPSSGPPRGPSRRRDVQALFQGIVDFGDQPCWPRPAKEPVMPANVAITQDTSNPYSESDIAINPGNVQQIIAASNANAGSTQAQYWSHDGGSHLDRQQLAHGQYR